MYNTPDNFVEPFVAEGVFNSRPFSDRILVDIRSPTWIFILKRLASYDGGADAQMDARPNIAPVLRRLLAFLAAVLFDARELAWAYRVFPTRLALPMFTHLGL